MGYDERASGEARQAFDLASRLSREDQLAVEGAYYEVWFWTQIYGDAGSSFWGGWSSSLSRLSMQVGQIYITQG